MGRAELREMDIFFLDRNEQNSNAEYVSQPRKITIVMHVLGKL